MISEEGPYVIVDASVSLKWALDDEENTENALSLRDDGLQGQFQMVAPSLWLYEVANGLVTAARRNRITPEQGRELLDLLVAIGLRFADSGIADCYGTAVRYRVALYDATYLALAQALEADLWTGDFKFFESVRKDAPFVRWIGDYPS